MKTTRRSLLQMIGLGAAAAALAPVKAAEAGHNVGEFVYTRTTGFVEPAQCHQCQPDSPFPHVYEGHPGQVGVVGGAMFSGYMNAQPVVVRDDTAYLQGLIDLARPGGTVMIPPGTYYIRDSIYVPFGVHLDGNGSTIVGISA